MLVLNLFIVLSLLDSAHSGVIMRENDRDIDMGIDGSVEQDIDDILKQIEEDGESMLELMLEEDREAMLEEVKRVKRNVGEFFKLGELFKRLWKAIPVVNIALGPFLSPQPLALPVNAAPWIVLEELHVAVLNTTTFYLIEKLREEDRRKGLMLEDAERVERSVADFSLEQDIDDILKQVEEDSESMLDLMLQEDSEAMLEDAERVERSVGQLFNRLLSVIPVPNPLIPQAFPLDRPLDPLAVVEEVADATAYTIFNYLAEQKSLAEDAKRLNTSTTVVM